MGARVPIDLLRLRSATRAYLAILRDSVPAHDDLATSAPVPMPEGCESITALRESVRAALDVDDAPGTPAAILVTLAQLVGER